MLSLLQQGLDAVFTFQVFGLVLFGTVIGIIFGAIPGLTSTMAVALFLPITYTLSPGAGISLLVALFVGGTSGGLISAILLKIPGTPSSIATTFDGGPMMEKGEAVKALGAGIVFSFLGTLFSIAALVFIAPTLAKVALRFGPHEYFAIAVFSLTLIATLASGSMIKGIFSGVVGFAFATVGIAPVDAVTRYTFGYADLNGGFQILTVLIGLFAVSEIIKVAETVRHEQKASISTVSMKNIKGFGFSMQEFFGQGWNFIRSSIIGTGIGILPGIGGGTSNIVSYIVAKNRSKHPEKFGTGILDGVVASALEAKLIREAVEPPFLIVTPGIRSAGAALGDQKRVATRAEAVAAGADYLVVGRPVTQSPDPAAALAALRAEVAAASAP
ncbi:MAG: tripartite tricarboxylate transporter permease [Proteobacteria bacterium]|nr:tripartite tricarboxylate transporter permease [Pseudomonadota bacterium]